MHQFICTTFPGAVSPVTLYLAASSYQHRTVCGLPSEVHTFSRNAQFGPRDLKRCMVQKSNMDLLWEIICMVIRYNNSYQINLPSPEPELLKYGRLQKQHLWRQNFIWSCSEGCNIFERSTGQTWTRGQQEPTRLAVEQGSSLSVCADTLSVLKCTY